MQCCCFRVLKEVHPDVGISKQGMQVMQTFAVDMFDRIMVEASRLCRISNKATLSSREIQTAGGLMPLIASYMRHTCLIHASYLPHTCVIPASYTRHTCLIQAFVYAFIPASHMHRTCMIHASYLHHTCLVTVSYLPSYMPSYIDLP